MGEERVELCHNFISFVDTLIDFVDNLADILCWDVLRGRLFEILWAGPWKVMLLQIQIHDVSWPDAVPDPWRQLTPERLFRFHQGVELVLVILGQVASKGSRINQQIPDVKNYLW